VSDDDDFPPGYGPPRLVEEPAPPQLVSDDDDFPPGYAPAAITPPVEDLTIWAFRPDMVPRLLSKSWLLPSRCLTTITTFPRDMLRSPLRLLSRRRLRLSQYLTIWTFRPDMVARSLHLLPNRCLTIYKFRSDPRPNPRLLPRSRQRIWILRPDTRPRRNPLLPHLTLFLSPDATPLLLGPTRNFRPYPTSLPFLLRCCRPTWNLRSNALILATSIFLLRRPRRSIRLWLPLLSLSLKSRTRFVMRRLPRWPRHFLSPMLWWEGTDYLPATRTTGALRY
jgi:hypothetical protein